MGDGPGGGGAGAQYFRLLTLCPDVAWKEQTSYCPGEVNRPQSSRRGLTGQLLQYQSLSFPRNNIHNFLKRFFFWGGG